MSTATPKVTLHHWRVLQESSVSISGKIIRPVILAEYRIGGKRVLHSMFQDPSDGDFKPVAMVPEATLNMADAEYFEALKAMNFTPPDASMN
jgi:hypothetical protein